jgi:hypothetical protein
VARTVTPPRPDLIRRPTEGFGWLEDRLLRDGWLARLGPEAVGVLVLMALAADRNGCSFYGRQRMAESLGLRRQDVDAALARLLTMRLVAHRPWRPGHDEGVWQLLPLPPRAPEARERRELPTSPRRSTEAEPDAVPVADAMGELLKKLALARERSASDHDAAPRAERRKQALPQRQ